MTLPPGEAGNVADAQPQPVHPVIPSITAATTPVSMYDAVKRRRKRPFMGDLEGSEDEGDGFPGTANQAKRVSLSPGGDGGKDSSQPSFTSTASRLCLVRVHVQVTISNNAVPATPKKKFIALEPGQYLGRLPSELSPQEGVMVDMDMEEKESEMEVDDQEQRQLAKLAKMKSKYPVNLDIYDHYNLISRKCLEVVVVTPTKIVLRRLQLDVPGCYHIPVCILRDSSKLQMVTPNATVTLKEGDVLMIRNLRYLFRVVGGDHIDAATPSRKRPKLGHRLSKKEVQLLQQTIATPVVATSAMPPFYGKLTTPRTSPMMTSTSSVIGIQDFLEESVSGYQDKINGVNSIPLPSDGSLKQEVRRVSLSPAAKQESSTATGTVQKQLAKVGNGKFTSESWWTAVRTGILNLEHSLEEIEIPEEHSWGLTTSRNSHPGQAAIYIRVSKGKPYNNRYVGAVKKHLASTVLKAAAAYRSGNLAFASQLTGATKMRIVSNDVVLGTIPFKSDEDEDSSSKSHGELFVRKNGMELNLSVPLKIAKPAESTSMKGSSDHASSHAKVYGLLGGYSTFGQDNAGSAVESSNLNPSTVRKLHGCSKLDPNGWWTAVRFGILALTQGNHGLQSLEIAPDDAWGIRSGKHRKPGILQTSVVLAPGVKKRHLGLIPQDRAPVVIKAATMYRNGDLAFMSRLTGATKLRVVSEDETIGLVPFEDRGELSHEDVCQDESVVPPSLNRIPLFFQDRLRKALDDSKVDSLEWLPGGKSFRIISVESLESQLPSVFGNESKFKSTKEFFDALVEFQFRQRIPGSPVFRHDYFHRAFSYAQESEFQTKACQHDSEKNDLIATLGPDSQSLISRGVTQRASGKWQAQIYFAGKSRYIGVFPSSRMASLAYSLTMKSLCNCSLSHRLSSVDLDNVYLGVLNELDLTDVLLKTCLDKEDAAFAAGTHTQYQRQNKRAVSSFFLKHPKNARSATWEASNPYLLPPGDENTPPVKKAKRARALQDSTESSLKKKPRYKDDEATRILLETPLHMYYTSVPLLDL